MPLSSIDIIASLMHLAAMVLFTLSFINMAAIVYLFSRFKIGIRFFPGTRLPLYPTFIAIGSATFLQTTFSYFYFGSLGGGALATEAIFYGMAFSLISALLALYGLNGFYWDTRKQRASIEAVP